MRPVIPSFGREPYGAWMRGGVLEPIDADEVGALFTPGGYHAFEHRWALAQAFDWQHGLGRARVAERTHGLATRLKGGLARLPHVTLVTPRSLEVSSGIVCFDVAAASPGQVVAHLAARRIRASVTPYAEQHVRLGTSLHVDEDDVDAVLRALA